MFSTFLINLAKCYVGYPLKTLAQLQKTRGIASSSTAGNMLFHMAQDRAFRVRSGNERGTILPITSQCTMCYFKVKQLNNVALKSELFFHTIDKYKFIYSFEAFLCEQRTYFVHKMEILCTKGDGCSPISRKQTSPVLWHGVSALAT